MAGTNITISAGETAIMQATLDSINVERGELDTKDDFSLIVDGNKFYVAKDNVELDLTEVLTDVDFDANANAIILPTSGSDGRIKMSWTFTDDGSYQMAICSNDGVTHTTLKYGTVYVKQEYAPVELGVITAPLGE